MDSNNAKGKNKLHGKNASRIIDKYQCHGVAPKNGPPGDLLAEIQIVLPKQLSEADRKAIQQIDEHYSQNPRGDLHW